MKGSYEQRNGMQLLQMDAFQTGHCCQSIFCHTDRISNQLPESASLCTHEESSDAKRSPDANSLSVVASASQASGTRREAKQFSLVPGGVVPYFLKVLKAST